MLGKTPLSSSYQALLAAVKAALTKGLLAAQKVLEYQRLKTYHEIGKDMTDIVTASNGELHLGEELYLKISKDLAHDLGLELSSDLLGRTVQFYKNYPVFPDGTTLTFSHYIALQRVHDPKLRSKLEKTAIKKNLTVPQVKEEVFKIKQDGQPVSTGQNTALKCERGEPYVYYARPQIALDGTESFLIDCGFKINIGMPEGNPYVPDQNRMVRSIKENGKYRIVVYPEGKDKMYTYAALITNVVDGDTVDARIDVGFGIGLTDRLRLKGINAPEIETPAGRLARKFLKDYFKTCPTVVIRSFKSEMYGRWLADVFCLAGCDDPIKIAAQGEYLNQVLLDKGLVELYSV